MIFAYPDFIFLVLYKITKVISLPSGRKDVHMLYLLICVWFKVFFYSCILAMWLLLFFIAYEMDSMSLTKLCFS